MDNKDYLLEGFINQAKPALNRHSGGGQNGDAINLWQYYVDNRGTKQCEELFSHWGGTDISPILNTIDFSNVTSIYRMFNSCSNLKTVPMFEMGHIPKTYYLFGSCSSLESVPPLDFRSSNSGYYTFSSCKKLVNAPIINTGAMTTMDSMFYYCESLVHAPPLDGSSTTTTKSMFYYDQQLRTASLYNLNNLTDVTQMFYQNPMLVKVKMHGVSEKITTSTNWFSSCKQLSLLDFRGATGVPTLASKSMFGSSGIPSRCKIVIPDDLYDAWTTATNWSAISVVWLKESEYEASLTEPLAGTWLFNSSVSTEAGQSFSWTVNFTSGSTSYSSLETVGYDDGGAKVKYWVYDAYDQSSGVWKWANSGYQVINITSLLDEVEDGEALLQWLKTNAVKLED